MEKVLVTGGAGFIGSHIVEALQQNQYEVIVIDNFSTGHHRNIADLSVNVHKCDITNPEVINLIASIKPDYIIHQAAQVSVAESVQNILFDEQVNVKGSLHVIKGAIRASVKKIVFASSAAVYGNPIELPITTKHRTLPESPYGLTKLTVEHYLQMASKFYQLPYAILRYSNVYGPRQDAKGEGGVVSIFADYISNQLSPTIFGDGEQTRDFIFVKDVATANVKALQAEENICVNVSSGSTITINELFTIMKKVANTKLNATYSEARSGDIRDSCLSNEETKAILGWSPSVNLFNGLFETIEYASKRNALEKIII
ncbi:NAD-dependent epimerase/dehydratase family protein [Heyndrickxia ginsengihumi]|uniref:NAD-dependent epimerase/dehydratase family protein n=1 Tax=Heyndrickxia ginsengihumi TaxID=363870 RepID=UPI0004712BF3|nr:NAD-dependent epimerase/dehydratase family protein [Heyndrickxia ginsengihumi]